MRSYKRNGGEPSSAPAVTRSSPATSAWRSSLLPASRRTPAFRSSTGSRRVRRNNGCAAGARCSPPGSVLGRTHIYGYGRSLRPPQGTSIARRRRAPFRQTILGGGRSGCRRLRRVGDLTNDFDDVAVRVEGPPLAVGAVASR